MQRNVPLWKEKEASKEAIYTGSIINCGENDHTQQRWPQNCWTNSEKAKNYLILHLKHKPWNGLLHIEKSEITQVSDHAGSRVPVWLLRAAASWQFTPCSVCLLCICFSVMVPMHFGLKDTFVQKSETWCLKFPKSVVQHHSLALSEIWLLNCAAAEGNLVERKNIGWRYSTIIQFHVHVHVGQEWVFPLQH